MRNEVKVRDERAGDEAAIRTITQAAFAKAEHSSGTEAEIVDALRAANALAVSLVADDGGALVGHVAFSPVQIAALHCNWYGLGPVSVRPDRQRQGIGTALIAQGLARLRTIGARGCVILGDPAYYGRFGFVHDDDLRLPGVPPEYFLRLSIEGAVPKGNVTYHEAFNAS
ncbi:MAG TPA: N-acetyltransferase [Rhizomicrobium sp.]|nr:N-acetyltransferase [Rhizomicrobium sp.]